MLEIHHMGGGGWGCPQSRPALGECLARWMAADLPGQWCSVILVESCWAPTRTAGHVEDSVSGNISESKLWDLGWGSCKWELSLDTAWLGPLTYAERGALAVFLSSLAVKSTCLSGNRWRKTGEIFRALKTTEHLSSELAWEVSNPRNGIYLLFPGMISCPWEEPVIAKPMGWWNWARPLQTGEPGAPWAAQFKFIMLSHSLCSFIQFLEGTTDCVCFRPKP